MTNAQTIEDQIKALGYQALVTQTDENVTVEMSSNNERFELKYCRDKEYSLQDLHNDIAREVTKANPTIHGEGVIADLPEKDKLRAKSIPQPGAEVHEPEGHGATPTEINKETFGTPAQGGE
jgi:hypothetical protein